MNSTTADAAITRWTGDAMQSRLRKRYRSERNFRLLGFGAVAGERYPPGLMSRVHI